jgi:hypothetical protein
MADSSDVTVLIHQAVRPQHGEVGIVEGVEAFGQGQKCVHGGAGLQVVPVLMAILAG